LVTVVEKEETAEFEGRLARQMNDVLERNDRWD
jgi:hypothetical protein